MDGIGDIYFIVIYNRLYFRYHCFKCLVKLKSLLCFTLNYLYAVPEGSEAVCLDMQGRYRMEQLAGRLWHTVWHGGTGQQQGSVLTLGPGPREREELAGHFEEHSFKSANLFSLFFLTISLC